MDKCKILILFANSYDMKTEDNRVMQGTSVHYLFWGENGEALSSRTDFDMQKAIGVQRAKCSLGLDARKRIPTAPAIYEGSFEMAVGSDGKPVLKLVDVTYVADLAIGEQTKKG